MVYDILRIYSLREITHKHRA